MTTTPGFLNLSEDELGRIKTVYGRRLFNKDGWVSTLSKVVCRLHSRVETDTNLFDVSKVEADDRVLESLRHSFERLTNVETYSLTLYSGVATQMSLAEAIEIWDSLYSELAQKKELRDHHASYNAMVHLEMMAILAAQIASHLDKDKSTTCLSMLDQTTSLLIAKSGDYGQSFRNHGVQGVLVRLNDKLCRLLTLISTEKADGTQNFESMQDTAKDMIGYCVIAVGLLEEMLTQS